MSFRTKLLLVVLLTIFASVSVVAYAVTHYTQAAFEEMDAERTEALVAQFKKEFRPARGGNRPSGKKHCRSQLYRAHGD